MGHAELRFTRRAVEIVVWGEVVYAAGGPDEACRVADWVDARLSRGWSPAEVRSVLGGAPAEHPGDGVLLAEAEGCAGALTLPTDDLRRALASGKLDPQLGALMEAEHVGDRRPAVLSALNDRRRAAGEGGWTPGSSST